MNKFEKQRDILFDACKKVATNQRTPQWISGILTKAVMEAKSIADEFPESLDGNVNMGQPSKPAVGLFANITALDNKPYTVRIIEESESVEGIKLFHVQIVGGIGPHKIGSIVYNIPETWFNNVWEE